MATAKKKTSAKSAPRKIDRSAAAAHVLALHRADHNAVIDLYDKYEKARRDR